MAGADMRRDYVQEAYEAFLKDVDGLDPTDPVKAIEAHFDRTASDGLKARVAAEPGRTAAACWRFVSAVARKALKGSSGHVDPRAVYAVAMHWYEDVPLDWDAKPAKAKPAKPEEEKPVEEKPKDAERETKSCEGADPAPRPGETAGAYVRRRDGKAKAKPRTPKARQGFFFDMLSDGDEQASVG